MAGDREYTRYQKGIINRYYQHQDTIMARKLGEIVSELYLAEGKAADRLWGRAEKALAQLAANDTRVKKVLQTRDVEGLARLANDLG
jgi:hypothetical protein